MKLKANRSFHTSGVGMVHAGAEFEVHDALGREMEERGLAARVGGSEAKAEPELENKMEPVAENKARKRKVRIEESPAEVETDD